MEIKLMKMSVNILSRCRRCHHRPRSYRSHHFTQHRRPARRRHGRGNTSAEILGFVVRLVVIPVGPGMLVETGYAYSDFAFVQTIQINVSVTSLMWTKPIQLL